MATVRTCPNCQNSLEIDDRSLGKKMLCPYCQQPFVPAYPHSGLGIISVLLAVFVIFLEIGIIAYFLINPQWESPYFTPKAAERILNFVRVVGFIASWTGMACAGSGYYQKRRNKTTVKWGMILNIIPNLFCVGYIGLRPFLPKPAEPDKDKEPEKDKEKEKDETPMPDDAMGWNFQPSTLIPDS